MFCHLPVSIDILQLDVLSFDICFLPGILYKLMFNLQTNDGYDFRWISHIRSVLDRTGFGYIFTSQIHVKFCNLKPLLFEAYTKRKLFLAALLYSNGGGLTLHRP
jgi:hypothetical protein